MRIFLSIISILSSVLISISAQAQGFAFFSCEEREPVLAIADAILALNPELVITQGDTPYTNRAKTVRGITTEKVQFDSVASGVQARDFNLHYEQMMANLGWVNLMAGPHDVYSQFDDHEWGGNDWAHNLMTANSGGSSINATTQAEVNYHWRQGRTAWQAWADTYSQNENAVRDIIINTETPSGASAEGEVPSPDDYRINYFRKTYGDIEFFFIDTISYRDYSTNQNETAVTMLGSQQKSWLIDKVNASSAMFIVIASTKKLGTTGTTDAWNYYNTEINEILSNMTKTGVLWISGDDHWPVVVKNSDDADYKYANVSIGNAGVKWSSITPENNYLGRVVWASDGITSGASRTTTALFGYGYVEDSQLHIQILDKNQKSYYHGVMSSSSNEITTLSAGVSLPLEDDADNDGVEDDDDNCETVANGPIISDPGDGGVTQRNTDADEDGDACDDDDDNDGVDDVTDAAPLDPTICGDSDTDTCDDCSIGKDGFGVLPDRLIENDGLDTDTDGACDAGDIDDDNDGVIDVLDNCSITVNASQTDTDGDAEGDACDIDDDNDGVVDEEDAFPLDASRSLEEDSGDSDSDKSSGGSLNPIYLFGFMLLFGCRRIHCLHLFSHKSGI